MSDGGDGAAQREDEDADQIEGEKKVADEYLLMLEHERGRPSVR